MKRSFLMSALVLALAASIPACGGGDAPKDGSDPAKTDEGDKSGGDPVVELKNISDGIQKAADDIFEPIKNADAVIDSVSKLPDDLKAMKSKVDPKKLMAELKKILDGADPALEALKLEDEAKGKVQERIDKLKALVNSIKTIDDKVKELGTKITDAITKVPAVGAKAMAKIEITLKNPLAGGDAKKKAEEDKKTLTGIIDGFKAKAAEWQKMVTELPGKAKEIPAKFAKAFK